MCTKYNNVHKYIVFIHLMIHKSGIFWTAYASNKELKARIKRK